MRGDHSDPDAMFSYISPAQRVPKDHPLRAIRTMVDKVLGRLWSDFEKLYSHTGRPSIPPERLLRALLLQVLYSVRSERMLMEQLDYNLLFRWFVGLSRKRVEEIFGWLKTVGMTRKMRHRGLPRVDWIFTFALAAYNLVRIRNLTAEPA